MKTTARVMSGMMGRTLRGGVVERAAATAEQIAGALAVPPAQQRPRQ
ncbi:hypothetical protein [Nonomuraea endophytica]|uniref:Uncharacterized protein n=1 Tax=Nonomuraea endophytica TaxID=714136 RepID=A0A7W8AD17_9ACTN|nr:hypothetical protein [Nonomuraea endophytica]MBB5083850.1 hypothetical protein [Nonomuraea endophytica]